MMKSKSLHHAEGNVWFGFAVGAVIGAGGLYLLGTKDGRVLLKKLIDLAENMELSAEDVISEIEHTFEESEAKPVLDGEEILNHGGASLHMVLDKIRQVFPDKKV